MNRRLQIFVGVCSLCLRITKYCCRTNFASGGLSSMLSTKETPKKLTAVLEQKNSSCSGDCCRLCECLFKEQKGDKFQHISTENFFQLPGKKGIEKRPLENSYQKIWDFTFPNYFSRACSKFALKFRNALELVRFL